jgi:hypothetical protein
MIYENAYQCGCIPTQTIDCPSSTPNNPNNDCIIICHSLVPKSESVVPCNTTGIIPITDLYKLPTDFDGIATFSILSHSDNITNVVIDSEKITFTSNWQADQNMSYKDAYLWWRIDAGQLANYAKIVIVFDQIADSTSCDPNFTYNPCNGDCEADPTDIATDLSSQEGTTDLDTSDPIVTLN